MVSLLNEKLVIPNLSVAKISILVSGLMTV